MRTTIHARTTDPATSHEAARSVRLPNVEKTRLALLAILANKSGTDAALWHRYNALVEQGIAPRVSTSGLRTRRAELVTRALVVDSGRRELLPTGRRAIVWALAESQGAAA